MLTALLARVERGNDRKAFDGWEPPKPGSASDPDPATPPNGSSGPSAVP